MKQNSGYRVYGAVAVVRLDAPPVNALGAAVRQWLVEVLARVEVDPAVRAVVLCAAGRQFSAGADLRESGVKPPPGPPLSALLDAVERCAKPWLASIHGAALGGGLELAMACRVRLASADARLGLPEVNHGLLPRAGGTQRLPRLVGVPRALQMIVAGQSLNAREALAAGLLDEVFEGDAEAVGVAVAERLLANDAWPAATCSRELPVFDAAEVAHLQASLLQRAGALEAPPLCAEAVLAATRLPFAEGLQREAELFERCRHSPQRAALIHRFFAERAVRHVPGLGAAEDAQAVQRVAVIGGGTMGVGIALAFAAAELPVLLLECDAAALARAEARIRQLLEDSQARGRLDAPTLQRRLALIQGSLDERRLVEADLVVEAVFEDLQVKQALLARMDRLCRPGAILASNTSSLDLDQLAAVTRRPQDVVGLHFFSPAQVMPLLEVVRGAHTSPRTLASALALARRLRKVAVVVGVCDGFVGNRMLFAYAREAEFLLEEGATPRQVDDALRRFGMAMGPFAMRDLSGLDVGQAIRRRQRALAPAHLRWPSIGERLCAAGMFGQKRGVGFFSYAPGERTPRDNPALADLLEAASADRGIERKAPSDERIVERTLYALINEGARILEEGIVPRASDIDVIYLNGYGFPAWRGGPMFHADQLGLPRVLATIRELHTEHGDWWRPAPLLERLVAEGRAFVDWHPMTPSQPENCA